MDREPSSPSSAMSRSSTLPPAPPEDAWIQTCNSLLPRWESLSLSHQVLFSITTTTSFLSQLYSYFSDLGFPWLILIIPLYFPHSVIFMIRIKNSMLLQFMSVLCEIFLQSTIPISISRVNQVDAARLDVEMSAMLKEQLVKVFSLMKVRFCLFFSPFPPPLLSLLSCHMNLGPGWLKFWEKYFFWKQKQK